MRRLVLSINQEGPNDTPAKVLITLEDDDHVVRTVMEREESGFLRGFAAAMSWFRLKFEQTLYDYWLEHMTIGVFVTESELDPDKELRRMGYSKLTKSETIN